MTQALYYAKSFDKNDTGFDSYSVPFISSHSSKIVNRAISEFKEEFPRSKMKWCVHTAYVDTRKRIKVLDKLAIIENISWSYSPSTNIKKGQK